MKYIIPVLTMWAWTAFAGSHGDALSEPKILLKMITALEESGIAQLTSKAPAENDSGSYHLRSVSYLGTISRGEESFTLAEVLFIRSSNKGGDHPPARGHGFLICFDAAFKVRSFCRMDNGVSTPASYLENGVLKQQEKVIVDFNTINESMRYRGFFTGEEFLPYPFADRISEEEWESGSFKNRK